MPCWFFSGSTIGNFCSPHEAAAFLRRAARILGAGLGSRGRRRPSQGARHSHRARTMPKGVTAKFNLNLLARIESRVRRQLRSRRLRTPCLLQRRTQPHRNASCQHQRQQARIRNETMDRIPRRRAIHTGEQLQIFGRLVPSHGPWQRLVAAGRVDGRAVQRPRLTHDGRSTSGRIAIFFSVLRPLSSAV